jgi:hypothetical protein
MKSLIASAFCTCVILGNIAAPTFADGRKQAGTSRGFLRTPRAEFLSNKLPTPDELFERQQQEQETLQNRWQQQQEQKQRQQNLRFQQQIERQQQQQFWLQQQQKHQLQQLNQYKLK